MQIPALLLTVITPLTFALAALAALAPLPVSAQASEPDAAAADAATSGESEAPDDDLEALYQAGGSDEDEDEDIEVIVVRAGESDSASDFESGDSVAAFDASDLEALGAQSIADLAGFTPNLEIVTSGATTPTFFIRGVGLNDFNANSSGAVAILLNDVPKNSPALQLGTLFDIENVNILRGPQGAGNYRGASAGAIKIYTKKPTGHYNATLRSTFGNYDAIDFEGAVGAPIFEDILAGRVAFRFSDRDGYQKNGCGNAQPFAERGARAGPDANLDGTNPLFSQCGEDVKKLGEDKNDGSGEKFDGKSVIEEDLPARVNNEHNWAARGTLLFQPTLDQEWLLTASGGKRDELSRLGQAYGTKKLFRSLNGPIGGGGNGILGSVDDGPYIPAEVAQQLRDLDPCVATDVAANGADVNLCFRPDGSPDQDKRNITDTAARKLLARDLARNLDSKPRTGDYNRVGPTQLETWGVSLKGDIVVSDSIDVTSVTGYDHYDRLVDVDLDQSPNELFEIRTIDDGWQFVQTLDLAGDVSDAVPVAWSFGGLFLYEELNVAVENNFGAVADRVGVSNRFYKQKLWSGGAHAAFSFGFWESFVLDGGVRYNWERKSIDYLLVRAELVDFPLFARKVWQAPTGSVRLTYNFKETAYAYWKYTRGWKGGHYNATGGDDGVFAADPENVDSFEIGLHGAWFDNVLSLDFSLFHYNYQNYQLFTAQQRFSGLPEFVVINAPNAEIYGSEMDVTVRPPVLQGLRLQARLAWLESQFLDLTQIRIDSTPVGGETLNVENEIQSTGNPLLNSPRFKVSLTVEQMLPLGRMGALVARWDGAWTADMNFDATSGRGVPNFDGEQILPKHTVGQRAFWLHNVSLTYRTPSGDVSVTGWVRNVTDQVYKTFAFDASFINNTTIHLLGPPRMFGMSLTTTFF